MEERNTNPEAVIRGNKILARAVYDNIKDTTGIPFSPSGRMSGFRILCYSALAIYAVSVAASFIART